MTQINMLEAKTDLSALVKMLETKQEDVIYLARNGKAVVQMTLIPKKQTQSHYDISGVKGRKRVQRILCI